MSKKLVLCIPLVGLVLLLYGCGQVDRHPDGAAPYPGAISLATMKSSSPAIDVEGKLTLWVYYEGADWIESRVKAAYPHIDLEIVVFDFMELEQAFMYATDAGAPPDLVLLDQEMLAGLSGLEIFEDLSEPPYEIERYVAQLPSAMLTPLRTLHDRHLYALPVEVNPAVLFYRHDLLEAQGFPSEPEEVARYIEDPARWLEMAVQLKQEGIGMITWETEPLLLAEYGSSFFNEELEFVRSTPTFVEMLELSQEVLRQELDMGLDIHDELGFQQLRDDRLAMFHAGWWMVEELEDRAPEMKGEWKLSRLPFGLYGSQGSSSIAIPVGADNKEDAWRVAQLLVKELVGNINDAKLMALDPVADEGHPFYGGQKIDVLYSQLVEQMPVYIPTPLDQTAEAIWEHRVLFALEDGRGADRLVRDAGEQIKEVLRSQIDILRNTMEQH